MSFFKFDEDDLFVNTVEAYPEFSFYIQSGTIYVNDRVVVTPDGERSELGVPDGFISLSKSVTKISFHIHQYYYRHYSPQ